MQVQVAVRVTLLKQFTSLSEQLIDNDMLGTLGWAIKRAAKALP